MKRAFFAAILICAGIAFCEGLFFIERGDTVFLTPAQTQSRAQATGAVGDQVAVSEQENDGWFFTQHGARVKIAEGILAQLENGANAERVFAGFAIKSFERLAQNIYLLIPEDGDVQKRFELSREILKDPAVKHSHPNLVRERRAR